MQKDSNSTGQMPPNTACSRLGVRAAFSSVFLGSSWVPAKWRYLVPPQAANASRYAISSSPIRECSTMSETETSIWIRKNGIGHAFSRELGCDCRRCTTISFNLAKPPTNLTPFPGWDDPPWRAHTSASILVGNTAGHVQGHVLIDCGAGVVDSLVCSGLNALDHLAGLLITHWHPDHVLSINQLCESLRRSAKRRGRPFHKLPVYCTLGTYDWLRLKSGLDYEFKTHLRLQEIVPEVPFAIAAGGVEISFTPVPVAHGWVEGALIFAAKMGSKKVVFGWDIDVPTAEIPNERRKNQDIIDKHLRDYAPDVLFMASNTWAKTGTGHTSYELARDYIQTIKPREVYLTHISGHEDGAGSRGYGWTDLDWENAVGPDGCKIARQGMVVRLYEA